MGGIFSARQALDRLAQEYELAGKEALFEALKVHLTAGVTAVALRGNGKAAWAPGHTAADGRGAFACAVSCNIAGRGQQHSPRSKRHGGGAAFSAPGNGRIEGKT